jgi:hypothetical protein
MTETATPTTKGALDKRVRESPARRLRRAAYHKFPSVFPNPDHGTHLAHWRQRDPEQNAKTSPPADEYVDLRCIWAVEFFTPSHIDSLLTGFANLGWDKDDDFVSSGNPATWVRRLREQPGSDGWLNLGPIDRPGKKKFVGNPHTAPLPPSAEYALGEIFNLTSSITCVVMGFVLNEEASGRFDRALRQTYETYFQSFGRGHTVRDPSSQKQSAIRAARAQFRAEAAGWFRIHLPGLFASSHLDGEFPTCEFVTLRWSKPFPKRGEAGPEQRQYLRLLDLDIDIDAWMSADDPGLHFSLRVGHDHENEFHTIAAIAEGNLSEVKLHSYGGLDRPSVAYYFNEEMQALLSRWALLALLAGYERHLNAVRDSETLLSPGRHAPLTLLHQLRTFISQSADIRAVASELGEFAQRPGSFFNEVRSFKPCNIDWYKNAEITLGHVLRERIKSSSAWLERSDRSVRDLLTQYGTILSAQENLRIQRQVGRLTILMTILTVIAAWTGAENSKSFSTLMTWLLQLFRS